MSRNDLSRGVNGAEVNVAGTIVEAAIGGWHMNQALINRARMQQTQRELAYVSNAVDEWLQHRERTDVDAEGNYAGRHQTQLGAFRSALTGAVQRLGREVDALDPEASTGTIYDACRRYDQGLVWLQRLWEYFRKFDQRDDSTRCGPLLQASDEVAWSCYSQVFILASARDPTVKRGPLPLTFIEPEYSPAAVQFDKPLPVQLRLTADVRFLDDFLKTLPVPILRLPPWSVAAPWWLVYVGHEIGHHIQHELKLVKYFRDGVEAAARASGLTPDNVDLWAGWSEEIFADVFSLMVMGTAALHGIVDAERSTPDQMVRRKNLYPSPAVRLALMATVADKLGLEGTEAIHDLNLRELVNSNAGVARDMQVVDAVIAFALGPMRDTLGILSELCGFNPQVFGPGGKVDRWAQRLRGTGPLPVERKLETARQIVSGSVYAWLAIAQIDDDQKREAARADLARRTIEALCNNAPPGTRAARTPDIETADRGAALAGLLLQNAGHTLADEGI